MTVVSESTRPSQELSDMFLRMSIHLDTLGLKIKDLEHKIGEQLCPTSPPQSATITQLQSLDYLRQSLEDIAKMTSLLSKTKDIGSISQDAAAKINAQLDLTDTKALFYPQTTRKGFGKETSSFGDLDLF